MAEIWTLELMAADAREHATDPARSSKFLFQCIAKMATKPTQIKRRGCSFERQRWFCENIMANRVKRAHGQAMHNFSAGAEPLAKDGEA